MLELFGDAVVNSDAKSMTCQQSTRQLLCFADSFYNRTDVEFSGSAGNKGDSPPSGSRQAMPAVPDGLEIRVEND